MNTQNKDNFWTEETESRIKQWLAAMMVNQTASGLDSTYSDYVYPNLKALAYIVVSSKARSWMYFSATKEDLVESLVSSAASALKYYDFKRGHKIYSYVWATMTRFICKEWGTATRAKRDSTKNVSLEHYVHQSGDPRDNYKIQHYDIYKDALFLDFFCQWWKQRLPREFKGKRRIMEVIIDIIEHPLKYPCSDSYYTQYLCSRFGVTRQHIHGICMYMRKYSNQIRNEYMGDGLLGLVFKK